ncbi:MAG: O-antigen ligase family protein [Nitrospina sp.]|jgi:O-antigen ligase|nr:O-antigen ligase family protein [Nitrospina sp.]MBT3855392.1 O-antigen ligase family protein [Nitrospina sp.]MBT4106062.1 O-antigen ligase family protein [Nitrospina sp.]MBT4388468.1 O-antigen ligase family protein [Nitrospina sp.]MBT4620929.1 O-antigen ligase family protein [Nitrospina sp.]
MLNIFPFFYLVVIVFLGCENIYFLKNIHDTNALLAFLSLAFLGMTFVLRKDEERAGHGVGILSVTLIVFLLFSATSFYFSLNADLSLYPALKVFNALLLAIALVYFLKDIETLRKAFLIIFILAGIHAGFGILQQFVPSLLYQPNKFGSTSTSFFSNPNYFSGYLVIHIPIGFYLLAHCRSSIWRMTLGGIWTMVWAAIGFSGSPGGQLLAAFMVLGMAVYLLKKKNYRDLKILGWCLIFALLVYIGLVSLLGHGSEPGSATTSGSMVRRPWVWAHMENRLIYWTGAWSIFKEHWLLGSGLWTFVELYSQTGLKYNPPHAHNMYLQTATETGLVGFGLLMACLTALGATLVRVFKRGSPDVAGINFYIALSLSGFLLHNLIEYNWLISDFIYLFVFLVISVEVLNRETQGQEKWTLMSGAKEFWPKAVSIIIVLGAFTIWQYYSYHRLISHGISSSQTVDELFANIERAKKLCHQCGRPHYLSGTLHLAAFRQSGDLQNLSQAENDFNEVARRNPYGMATYLMLGEIKSLQGNFSEARKYYKKSIKDPRSRNAALTGLKNLEKSKDNAERTDDF